MNIYAGLPKETAQTGRSWNTFPGEERQSMASCLSSQFTAGGNGWGENEKLFLPDKPPEQRGIIGLL